MATAQRPQPWPAAARAAASAARRARASRDSPRPTRRRRARGLCTQPRRRGARRRSSWAPAPPRTRRSTGTPRSSSSRASWACGGILTGVRQGVAPRNLLRHNLSMAESNSARVVISWSAKANAYVARDPARPGILARGATLAEAARELAAAVEPKAGKPLVDAVDAIQREVTRKRLRVSRKEIAAEARATRAERRRRG